jgi:hypothetical protein
MWEYLIELERRWPDGIPVYDYNQLAGVMAKYILKMGEPIWRNADGEVDTSHAHQDQSNLRNMVESGRGPVSQVGMSEQTKQVFSTSAGRPIETYEEAEEAGLTLEKSTGSRPAPVDRRKKIAEDSKKIKYPTGIAQKYNQGQRFKPVKDPSGQVELVPEEQAPVEAEEEEWVEEEERDTGISMDYLMQRAVSGAKNKYEARKGVV